MVNNLMNPVCLWSDNDWCYYCEREDFDWKSDEYQVIEWEDLPKELKDDDY